MTGVVAPITTSRAIWMNLARAAFLIAAAWFGWWSLRGQWSDVARAASSVSVVAWTLAVTCTMTGLVATGICWRLILRAYGHDVAVRSTFSVFFVGQLGKYIPGSVWSFGAQAQMAVSLAIPPRTTVAAGLVLLGWSVVSAAIVGAVAALTGVISLPVSAAVCALGLIAAIAALLPAIVNRVGSRLSGSAHPLRVGWRESGSLAVLMGMTWLCYGMAIMMVLPHGNDSSTVPFLGCMGAFAVSYVVGVLMVFAPAGIGAREAVLAIMLAPYVGVPAAVATALICRATHTLCDFTIAGLSWASARSLRRSSSRPVASGTPHSRS